MTTLKQSADLIAAAGALIDAQELMRRTCLIFQAPRVREIAEEAITAARALIEAAITSPSSGEEQLALLDQAIELDGVESPLVARVAAAFAAMSGSDPAPLSLVA